MGEKKTAQEKQATLVLQALKFGQGRTKGQNASRMAAGR
jgi:hypothetical protein